MTDWCILRMSPGRTLAVAQSLAADGFAVWTPQAVEVRRVGRDRHRVERDVPVVPGIVFADYDAVPRLVTISRTPGLIYRTWNAEQKRMVVRDHPPFSVMRYLDGYPRVADRALDPLRLAERRSTPLAKVKTFAPGERVRYPASGFDGLTGIVQTTRGRFAMVLFPGFAIPVQIAPRLLLSAA